MDAYKTEPTPRLLLARAAVLAMEERRKPDDADPRSTRPLADAALEERARVLAEVLGQAERRSSAVADPSGPTNASVQLLGAPNDADEPNGQDPTGDESTWSNAGVEQGVGPVFTCSLASSSSLYRDDLRLEDGEDGPTELFRTEVWQDHPAGGVPNL